jgi:hypothetical protein
VLCVVYGCVRVRVRVRVRVATVELGCSDCAATNSYFKKKKKCIGVIVSVQQFSVHGTQQYSKSESSVANVLEI